ncbi:hypothetical protein T11_18029 [Trichinella zimbabwensis]|uniref:Uncharacterized protein n=1 Tax=Trichinella zimbabwensis TaxID=268475 RepID=A0A0V1HGK3_9BILA|nr:hypothetical protein T11_18029 [Trichinella zimbabwensis]
MVHKNISVRVHKWLCQLLNNGVARPIWRFSTLLPSITILCVTYPVDLHTVLCWSNGQYVWSNAKAAITSSSQPIIFSNK